MAGSLHVEDLAPGIRALTLSNPTKKNAIDAGMLDALETALRNGGDVRAWLVRSDDASVFSAGYDLNALAKYPEGTPLPDERLGDVLDLLASHHAPSVALVRGAAVGAGCELAVACDFRIGIEPTRFVMPPARVGVVYALRGMARVRSCAGAQLTRRMFLLGKAVESEEALRFGLLDAVVAEADAAKEATALCEQLATQLAPLAVRGMKRGLQLVESGVREDAPYEVLRRESFNSADAKEGRDALLERRSPRFSGR
ncbi:MAG: enoyl-CoA hydratase-related protein [Archangium sp.]